MTGDVSRRDLFRIAAVAGIAPMRSAAPLHDGRQIHLDFHTSELIEDAGADFNAREFVDTLRAARVNSINVFAKCHHGYAYYDTKVAKKHPALKIDLLGEMVRACRPAGISVNYYYSLVWDVLQSRLHPEWRCLDRNGRHIGLPPGDAWPWICMNSPYMEQVVAENEEILGKYEVDGSWFDILKQPPEGCFCRWCRAERQKLGLSDSADDVFRHNKIVAKRVEKRLFELTRARNPKALVFFNSRLVIGVRDELPWYSHIEIESLPTGGWGYSHFQQRVRYMRTLGKEMVGMTGRFHKSWGDFGGLKNQAALDFECLNFLANGTKVCVGDQLHPRGKLDAATYERIGRAYRKIEALEPWAAGARPVADIGVFSSAATNPDMATQKVPAVDQGFTNMLIELHHQFDVLDLESELSGYKLVILPDEVRPSAALAAKLERYLAGGGALLVSHESLLDRAAGRFALPLGVRYVGPAKFQGEYMLLRPGAFPSIPDTPYFLYQPGLSIAAESGTEVLATYGHPYFDRAPEHFSSHKQTPLGRRTDEPLIARKGRVIYVANPFFRSYSQDGYGVQKLVVGELIRMLLPQPVVVAPGLPSTAQVTVLEQPQAGGTRHVVHVLYYPLTRRAPDIDIIEEPGLLENVAIRLRTPRKPARVALVPQNQALEFRYEEGYASCEAPRVVGHQAIVFE
jgi:hypothetical protein